MKINDIIITESLETIINVLKEDLANNDIHVFKDIKVTNNNIQVTCPFHKHGQENKPSFGINTETGACNCFTCGWKGYLPYLISQLYGYDDDSFGKEWLIKNFDSLQIGNRQTFKLPSRSYEKKVIEVISEEELDSYRYYHPYMYERGLTDELIERFDIGYDKNTKCITFPIKDLDNNVIFIARRSVYTKYFNYPSSVDKPVYGAYLFKDGKYKECYITESFFNCLTLWKLGLPAVALMGTGSQAQLNILDKLPIRQYIIALDPDDAGRKGTLKLRHALESNHLIQEIKYEETDKDINDLQEKFLDLQKVF